MKEDPWGKWMLWGRGRGSLLLVGKLGTLCWGPILWDGLLSSWIQAKLAEIFVRGATASPPPTPSMQAQRSPCQGPALSQVHTHPA